MLNIHIAFNSITNASRLRKETSSLIKLGIVDKILVVGIHDTDLLNYEEIDNQIAIIRLRIIKQKPGYNFILRKVVALIRICQFLLYSLWAILKRKPQVISCHNLVLLPVAVIAKYLIGAKLVYTPHELETERQGLKSFNKFLAKLNEKIFIRFANQVVVVCEPIGDWYVKEYNLDNVSVVQNVPYNPYIDSPLSKKHYFREEFGIPEEHIIFIYQGIISNIRGCTELIDNFKEVSKDRHLIMMGFGDLVPYLESVSEEYPNIHFKEAVSIEKIIEYTSSADVGFFYIPFAVSTSYRYSLPNKFFEYLIGGLPVIVSESLEYLSSIIQQNHIGWVLSNDKKDFINLINNIDREHIMSMCEKVESYAQRNSWQFEEKKFKYIYI